MLVNAYRSRERRAGIFMATFLLSCVLFLVEGLALAGALHENSALRKQNAILERFAGACFERLMQVPGAVIEEKGK